MSNAGIITERGDVKATGTMTDNTLIRGDDEKRIQDSGIACDDSDNLTGINTLAVVDDATTRSNLGLGSISTQDSNSVTISGGSITGITDLTVADGGSGRGTATAYGVICGGTTATAAHQSIAGVGTSGQVLTSNGAGALPTMQDAGGGGNAYQAGILNSANTAYAGWITAGTPTTQGVVSQRMYLYPLIVSESFTIAKLHMEITTAVAGATGRMGIYEFVDTGTFTLVADGGTFSAATTGIKSVTVSTAITPSSVYYTALTIDENGGSVSGRAFSVIVNTSYNISGATIGQFATFFVNSIDPASSLPATAAVTGTSGNFPIVVFSKV